MGYRIGADIGGTFTDIVLVADGRDAAAASLEIGKVLTTPEAPERAVLEGIEMVLARAGRDAAEVSAVIHGTTLFTNAMIERKGARTALVTTKGFRDAIEIAREHRYDMYDLFIERPEPLAPRDLRFEVDERVLADGSIHRPLDEASVAPVIEALRAADIEAVAVCLLHAYANDSHEHQVGAMIAAALPDIAMSLSADIVREIREFDRASTTLANVYVKRLAETYLGRLDSGLRDLGIGGDLFVMQSNGGFCDIGTASTYPVRLVESGPAAGALAAAHYGKQLGHADVLSFDMGGTTAKACVIADGAPLIAREFEVDRQYQFKRGSGLPVKMPVIEMIEIGTGGGSIARIDNLGRVQVGPESAGAAPGPVAYGLGGTSPTVTDADLVLGYLDPAFFLGGEMSLDLEAARRVIEEAMAAPLGLSLPGAAYAIHQLANESMASAARIHAIERGKDVGAMPLFAFGGAGPVHAWGVANILRCATVIYPFAAGVMSAVGFLVAPATFDFVRTLPGTLDELDWNEVAALFDEMAGAGREVLARSDAGQALTFERAADMRYSRQGFDIRVKLPDGPLGADRKAEIVAAFDAAYADLYGHTIPGSPIEVVSWRLVAQGPKPVLRLPEAEAGGGQAKKGERSVWRPETRCFESVPVYDRYQLDAGTRLEGPLIVEEQESTVVITGDAEITIDAHRNLIATRPNS